MGPYRGVKTPKSDPSADGQTGLIVLFQNQVKE
jgi:hypothetical protein